MILVAQRVPATTQAQRECQAKVDPETWVTLMDHTKKGVFVRLCALWFVPSCITCRGASFPIHWGWINP